MSTKPPAARAAACLALLLASPRWMTLAAQDTAPVATAQPAASDEVFAPYTSRIRVGIRGGTELIISWEDSPDVTGGYIVYRFDGVPSTDTFPSATAIGEVADGVKTLTYVPPDGREYYYAVLARNPEGGVYQVFIVLRNTTLVPIATAAPIAAPAETPPAAPVATAAPTAPLASTSPTPAAPTVTAAPPASPLSAGKSPSGILARTEGDAISVSIDAPKDIGRLILYRSTSPIRSSASLLEATVATIMEPGLGPFRDYPVPGVDYYYAVVPELDMMSGRIAIVEKQNATTAPVRVPAGAYRVGLPAMTPASRSIPLPYLVLTRGLSDAHPVMSDAPVPTTARLSAETEKAIATLVDTVGSTTELGLPRLTIYPEDLQSPGGGEEYSLRIIVASYLAKGQYEEAVKQFTLYLSLPRSPKNAARARFYRGEALALTGSYQEAFFDLLQAQEFHYLECGSWIDYILEQLRKT